MRWQQRQRLTYVSTRMIVLIIGFLYFMAGIMPGNALAAYYTFLPTDDVHVDLLAPNGGYPFAHYLYTNGEAAPAHAYLKFNLDIPATDQVTEAILNLYCVYGYKAEVDLYHISDDSWDELSLNWNNRPAMGSKGLLLDAAYVRYPFSWVHWDLFHSEAWDVAADQADGYVSLLISPPYGDIFMFSKEFADGYYEPFLTTTTTTMSTSIPIPPSCWLLASSLAVLGSLRKFSGISHKKRDLLNEK